MKVLELFCGTAHISNEFKRRGHQVMTVDWSWDREEGVLPMWQADIGRITADDVVEMMGGKPDMIWAAPDCTTFSKMAVRKHRERNWKTGEWEPRSQYARLCDKIDQHVLELIAELNPKVFIIENPVGAMRSMRWMQFTKPQTTRYSLYGFSYPKPTDFWSNINLRLRHSGEEHVTMGLKDVKSRVLRSTYPPQLVSHMVDMVEEHVNR